MLKQHKFLNSLLESIEKPDEAKLVLADLNALRDHITQPKNMAIHLTADWSKMEKLNIDLTGPWAKIIRSGDQPCREKYTQTITNLFHNIIS